MFLYAVRQFDGSLVGAVLEDPVSHLGDSVWDDYGFEFGSFECVVSDTGQGAGKHNFRESQAEECEGSDMGHAFLYDQLIASVVRGIPYGPIYPRGGGAIGAIHMVIVLHGAISADL